MQNLLFKISDPTAVEGQVEFYSISLSMHEAEGKRVNVVQGTHGWWSNESGQATFDEQSTTPPEEFEDFGTAVDRYCALQTNLAWTGFRHSFSWHRFTYAPRIREVHCRPK